MIGEEARSEFIGDVRKADLRDNALFTLLFDRGVKLLLLSQSEPSIADWLRIDIVSVIRWRAGVQLPNEWIRRSILEKLVQKILPELR